MAPPPDFARLLQQIQYPGMTYVETEITRAWLEQFGRGYDSIDFNVRLGEGTPAPAGSLPETERMALALSQKRADIVARRSDGLEILEVKVRAGLGALGQLQGYRILWLKNHPDERRIFLTVLARSCDADTKHVLDSAGVNLVCLDRGRK